jgi:hypothetical protein
METRLLRCDEAKARNRRLNPFRTFLQKNCCFDEPVATDLLLGEQKIAGGAQRRRREGFLHQGSIQLPKGISFEELRGKLLESFERKFGIAWKRTKIESLGGAV